MAQQLIDTLSASFDPTRYRDDYRDRVLDLIERKASGEEIAVAPEVEEPVAAPDLMAALEASLAAVGEGSDSKPKPKRRSSSSSSSSSIAISASIFAKSSYLTDRGNIKT